MIICLCLLFAGRASAQWVVSDPGNLAQGIINCLQEHHPHLQDRHEHGEQLSGDGENLRAGQEVLRCPQIGEQSGQGRPQGAADHPDGGRHHGHLCEQLPKDAAVTTTSRPGELAAIASATRNCWRKATMC